MRRKRARVAPRGVHDRGDVVRHALDGESLIGGVGEAGAAVVETKDAKPPQLRHQVVPERQVECGPCDQDERLTLAVDLLVDACLGHRAVRHHRSVTPTFLRSLRSRKSPNQPHQETAVPVRHRN
jgi:hypothetical protein